MSLNRYVSAALTLLVQPRSNWTDHTIKTQSGQNGPGMEKWADHMAKTGRLMKANGPEKWAVPNVDPRG